MIVTGALLAESASVVDLMQPESTDRDPKIALEVTDPSGNTETVQLDVPPSDRDPKIALEVTDPSGNTETVQLDVPP
ncbi:hypothetical protein H7H98_09290, partial [Mycolicibacterium sphagni]|nr:hypothetical protein [Mycolicibacterium sphagni]